jgi:hypothetical protein
MQFMKLLHADEIHAVPAALPPKMLARSRQLDYDREPALVALLDREFIAVVMEANHDMLNPALRLGFELQSREGTDVTVVSRLS